MTSSSCRHFNNCSAPLCPHDKESLENGIWYPDEEVCRKKGIDWVSKQRKIQKVKADETLYFDLESLNKLERIKAGLRGQDPDKK